MNLLILASVVIFALLIKIAISKSNKETENANKEFWEKERKSNFVRKKSLDDLSYITFPDEFIEYDYDLTNSRVNDAKDSLIFLKDKKIINFSGISNTDLKLNYGTANITVLSEYDRNYTTLVRSFQVLAASLYENGNKENAKKILEFSINTGSDVSSSFKLLGTIYKSENNLSAINELIDKATKLNSPMKTAILESLNDYL